MRRYEPSQMTGMSMDANLNFVNASVPNALQIGEKTPIGRAAPATGQSMLGKEFANLMRGLLPDSERQDLAAADLAASHGGLQTMALGTQFSVITADAPQPDANSLAAFAKAQGLDDRAVQALFGDLEQLPALGLGVTQPPLTVTTTPDPMAWLTNSPVDRQLAGSPPPSWFINATQPGTPSLAPISSSQSVLPSSHPATNAETLEQLLVNSGASATLARLGQVINTPAAELAPTQGLALPPEPGPLDAIRMRLIPAWESMTRSLAKVTGSDVSFSWASFANDLLDSQASGVTAMDIDLGDTSIGALTDTGNGVGTVSATFNNDNSAQQSSAASNRPALTLGEMGQTTTGPSTGERADQISQLADKLGKALSERLQDQMAQGQWKLELRLKPGHLGKISVELDMNASGLDALFKSENPLTRELIAQSAPKLRDSLAQAGMAVANVWVNSDGQQQTGGNPTPRQMPQDVPSTGSVLNHHAEVKVQTPRAKSMGGWDELV